MDGITAAVSLIGAQMALTQQSIAISAVKQSSDSQQAMVDLLGEALSGVTYDASGAASEMVESGSLLSELA
jgi:hypothetical protein